CGGPEEIIEDGITGLLAANGSPEAVASAIVRLRADSSERQRMAKTARRVVESRFTLDRQVQSYGELYRQCLDNRGHPRFSS
ncbi:MAG: glycosyltransferase, partial [Gemmatimonadota bacterium]|nr:glycosyltransferase [Gemmatimonadota bacterium]